MTPYDPASVLRADYLSWLRELAAAEPFGARDRRGTLNYVDEKARRRATQAITGAGTADLARPLSYGIAQRRDGKPAFDLEVFYTDGPIGMGSDHLELDCHGLINTHVDGLNHLAIDGNWYGGWAVGDPDGPSIMDFVPGGVVVRAVHADVPAARGTEWVDAQAPVTAQDIERALALGGVTLEPGDALLLDMGRDRYESAGHVYGSEPVGTGRPGLGLSGARWIAERQVSVLCWDFLDANHPDEPAITGHGLNWAIGLVLVDNCSFTTLRAAAKGRAEGALVFGVLPMPGATGCNVNPVVLL
jgi:kynurenine formamidase